MKIFASINNTRLKRKLPKVVSVDQLHTIFKQKPNNYFDIRDAAICELFYSSGLRLKELAQLNYADIDLKTCEVRVINGKRGKHRVVPLGSCARKALLLWNNARIHMKDLNKQALFISRLGTRLSTRQIRDRVKAYGKKVDPNLNLYPHKLRHSMATHLLESSNDLRAVQELLGHACISTTEIYTHLNFGILSKAFDGFHPRAKRKNKHIQRVSSS